MLLLIQRAHGCSEHFSGCWVFHLSRASHSGAGLLGQETEDQEMWAHVSTWQWTALLFVPWCFPFIYYFHKGTGSCSVPLQAIIISESFWSSCSLKKPVEKDILNNSITYFDRANLGWENCCFLDEDLFIYFLQILSTELRWN